MPLFRHLHYGLAAAVGFVGLKMIAEWLIPHEGSARLVPTWLSLTIIVGLVGAGNPSLACFPATETGGRPAWIVGWVERSEPHQLCLVRLPDSTEH